VTVLSAILLGATLLILADGSWLGLLPSRGIGSQDLRYLLGQPNIIPLGPLRLWLVGGAVLLWALPLVWRGKRAVRGVLVAPWLVCVAIGTAQWLTLRSFAEAYDVHVAKVFEEATQSAGASPPIGLYGIADLMGDRTALAPNHRFAHYAWSCTGTSDISWGRYADDGAVIELIPERAGFWTWPSPGRPEPRRVRAVDDKRGRRLEIAMP
jgi:hypothetical protein